MASGVRPPRGSGWSIHCRFPIADCQLECNRRIKSAIGNDRPTMVVINRQHSKAEPMSRVFCAIEIPSDVRQRIAEHAERLRHAVPDVQASWTKPENIHLTLKFFGNITPHQVLKASEAASRTTDSLGPLTMTVGETGAFPVRGPAKVLWIGICDPTRNLWKLHEMFEEQCELEGFAKEERAFHPHLTVARLRHARGARMLAEKHKEADFLRSEISVSGLILFRSELGPKGSRYSSLSEHLFKSG